MQHSHANDFINILIKYSNSSKNQLFKVRIKTNFMYLS